LEDIANTRSEFTAKLKFGPRSLTKFLTAAPHPRGGVKSERVPSSQGHPMGRA
jgi:hypothetical protein